MGAERGIDDAHVGDADPGRRGRSEVAADVDPVLAGNLLRDAYLGLLYRWTQAPESRAPLHAELRAALGIALTGVLSYAQRGWSPRAAPGTGAP
ncbi:hypothetical protein [Streptomyces sp. NPDC047718]|uniref:hypothetical protein n=1 Tax=Streptomyces sp. NPDC047718 TaxID=3155479 RepID=UPI0033E97E55